MKPLPPLTERLPPGSEGGLIFERLMHQLLLEEGKRKRVNYEITSGPGGDRFGVDGRVIEGNILGIEGPFGIEFKWLWGRIDKKPKSQKIEEKLHSALAEFPEMKTWVLVTPLDFSIAEKEWFDKLANAQSTYKVVHWGKAQIDNLLYSSPVFLARFYPEAVPKETGYEIADFNAFLNRYTATLVAEYETLRLIGIPTKSYEERDQKKQVPLRKIFIPQCFQKIGKSESNSIDLSQLVKSEKNAKVILGDPGSGKTTLLTFLTLLFCGQADLKEFEKTRNCVPIMIPIREFVKAKKSIFLETEKQKPSFVDFVVQKTKEMGLREAHALFFEYLLEMGEAIVFFDGLDEVSKETDRANMAIAIKYFSRLYPSSQIYVTSRIIGYSGDVRLDPEEFEHYQISQLNISQIETFVSNWYKIQILQNEREQERKISSMITAINRHPRVKRLASNPLLLTLMALIHEHEAQLPRDRGTLYDRCIDMLIFRWELRKEEELDQPNLLLDVLKMPEGTVRRYLAELALWIQTQNENVEDEEARGIVNEERLLDFLTNIRTDPKRGRDKEIARQEMTKFVDYIRIRAGLLVEKGAGQFSFVHLSFLEYLAAEAKQIEEGKTDEEKIDFILQHLDKPNWREVILLLLGIIGNRSEQFLDKFVKRALSTVKKHKSDDGLETLGRILCDNLSLRHEDADDLLQWVLSKWSEEPLRKGRWYDILSDIALFATRYENRLKEMVDYYWKNKNQESIPALVLRDALFRWDSNIAEKLQHNPHFREIAPKLLPFYEREKMSEMLQMNTTLSNWFTFRYEMGLRSQSYLTFFAASLEENYDTRLEAELAWTWREILTYHMEQNKIKYPRKILVASFSTAGAEATCLIYSPFSSIAARISPAKALSQPLIDISKRYTGEKDPEMIFPFRKTRIKEVVLYGLLDSLGQVLANSKDKNRIANALLKKLTEIGTIERCLDWFSNPPKYEDFVSDSIAFSTANKLLQDYENIGNVKTFLDTFSGNAELGKHVNDYISKFFSDKGESPFIEECLKQEWISISLDHPLEPFLSNWKNERDYFFNIELISRPISRIQSTVKSVERDSRNQLYLFLSNRPPTTGEPVFNVSNPYLATNVFYFIWLGNYLRTIINLTICENSSPVRPSSLYKQLWEQLGLISVWDSVVKYYKDKICSRFSGLRGALFVAQAALVSQAGGHTPRGSDWEQMFMGSEKEDKRLVVSAILYDIVRDPAKAAFLKEELRKVVIEMKSQHGELLFCAGFLDEKGNITI